MSISAYLELDSGEIMDEIKDTDIFQDTVREVAVEAAKEYFDSHINETRDSLRRLREEFEAKHERLFGQIDARLDDANVDFETEIIRLSERIDGLRATGTLSEKDTEEGTTEKYEFSGAGVGLIIRFATEEDLEKFVRGQLTDLFEPVLPLRTRHADSSDPKELFVLNRGRDGR
jgi:hypothetical protein